MTTEFGTTRQRLADRNIWARGLYMLFFWLAYSLAEFVMGFIVLFQFVAALFTGHVNAALTRFGCNLSGYIYQIMQFVTFNDEVVPYPFSDWPDDEPGTTPWQHSVAAADATKDNVQASEHQPAAPAATPVVDEAGAEAGDHIPPHPPADR